MVFVELVQTTDQQKVVSTLLIDYAATLPVKIETSLLDTMWIAGTKDGYGGCIGLRELDNQTGEIKRLYVSPAARGRGLGKALIEAAIAEARARAYHRIRLDTMPTMKAAQGLYRAFGFKPIAPYYESPHECSEFFELQLVS